MQFQLGDLRRWQLCFGNWPPKQTPLASPPSPSPSPSPSPNHGHHGHHGHAHDHMRQPSPLASEELRLAEGGRPSRRDPSPPNLQRSQLPANSVRRPSCIPVVRPSSTPTNSVGGLDLPDDGRHISRCKTAQATTPPPPKARLHVTFALDDDDADITKRRAFTPPPPRPVAVASPVIASSPTFTIVKDTSLMTTPMRPAARQARPVASAKACALALEESSPLPPPTRASRLQIVVIGPTGAGKSSLVNHFSVEEHVPVSSHLDPDTAKTKAYHCSIGTRVCKMYDTPGLGDTPKSDSLFMHELVKTMHSSSSGIDKVFFCCPVTETRVAAHMRYCLGTALGLLPQLRERPECFTFVFTRADEDARHYWGELMSGRCAELAEKLLREFGLRLPESAFICCGRDNFAEVVATVEAVDDASPNLQSEFMTEVQCHKDALRQLERKLRRLQQEKENETRELQAQLREKAREAEEALALLSSKEEKHGKHLLDKLVAVVGEGAGAVVRKTRK
eukprot:TRINITY_DN7275_c0_g1_i3.p1 TRINITY_DN7275_c0_g1~~TRINITY_DN7275_c0_g1_i3.p1  ORF type:complete len:507 (-),score=113.21 TRINITY_DN7275_c0_g1_i3:42-1562(-)